MNGHRTAVVVLHTIASVFALGCVAVIWIAASQLSGMFEGSFIPGLVSMIGKPIAVGMITLASLELIAALALLRQRQTWPRVVLGIISALQLFVFPIGTALGAYTFLFLFKFDLPPIQVALDRFHHPRGTSR